MFTVYAIFSQSSGKIYIGQSRDLDTRLKQHNAADATNLGRFTKQNKGPWKLIHKEEFETRSEALIREKQLKSYKGREFVKNLITRP